MAHSKVKDTAYTSCGTNTTQYTIHPIIPSTYFMSVCLQSRKNVFCHKIISFLDNFVGLQLGVNIVTQGC